MRLSVLLMFLVALAQSSGSRCKDLWKNQQDFNAFSKKHILSFDIRRNWNMKDLSKEFEKYLQKHGLCGRVPLQTFFGRCDKNRVEKICNGQGFEDGPGNLCISEHRFTVYLVESRKVRNRCKIQKIDIKTQYVIVGCGKIKNYCLPVHFDNQTDKPPNTKAARCKP